MMNATETHALTRRIADLAATPPALVRCDEGTHGTPVNYMVYETVEGVRYAARRFGNAAPVSATEADAEEQTAGTLRTFSRATATVRWAAAELTAARKQLAKADR